MLVGAFSFFIDKGQDKLILSVAFSLITPMKSGTKNLTSFLILWGR